jgi:hypothetical protein
MTYTTKLSYWFVGSLHILHIDALQYRSKGLPKSLLVRSTTLLNYALCPPVPACRSIPSPSERRAHDLRACMHGKEGSRIITPVHVNVNINWHACAPGQFRIDLLWTNASFSSCIVSVFSLCSHDPVPLLLPSVARDGTLKITLHE